MTRVPILVILGSTGSGKSRLGIELALKFCGEIISADSMQVYKGLDVVTAKVTKEEQAMVPHHMIDIVNPSNRLYTVVDFRNKALPIMDSILERKKVPIIVGGTNYWIESLLWQILIGTENNVDDNESVSTSEKNDKRPVEENSSEDDDRSAKKMKHSVSDLFSTETTQQLHQKLQEVDPEMARRTHPNNRRKIIRTS